MTLPPPHVPGERPVRKVRRDPPRVYMNFRLHDGWSCPFLEEDVQTVLPLKLHFKQRSKLFEIAERGGALHNLAEHQAIEHGIEIGRGGVWPFDFKR